MFHGKHRMPYPTAPTPVYGDPEMVTATNSLAFVYMESSNQIWAIDLTAYDWLTPVVATAPVGAVLQMDTVNDHVVLITNSAIQVFSTALSQLHSYPDLPIGQTVQGIGDGFVTGGLVYFSTFNNTVSEGWLNVLDLSDGSLASFAQGSFIPTRIAGTLPLYANIETYYLYTYTLTGVWAYDGGPATSPTVEGGDTSGYLSCASMLIAGTNIWFSSPTAIPYIPTGFTSGQNNTAGIFAPGSYGSPTGKMVLSPDGTSVYWLAKWAVSGTPTVSIVNVSSRTKTGTLPLPSGWTSPDYLAVTPDGSKLIVANTAAGQVAVINTTGGGVLAVLSAP